MLPDAPARLRSIDTDPKELGNSADIACEARNTLNSISLSSQPVAIAQPSPNPGAPAPAVPSIASSQSDAVELSPAARAVMEAGRIAVGAKSGNLTGSQASQLFSQLSTVGQQIQSDKQANGGTLSQADTQSLNEAQNQLGQQIYADRNSGSAGTAPPHTFNLTDARQLFQTGRVTLDEKAGKLSSTQATQLFSQIQSTQSTVTADLQASGGSLTTSQAQAVTQLQNQISAQIYSAAHPSGGSNSDSTVSATA